MKGIPWRVWVDGSKIEIDVVAERWFQARALAAAKLNVSVGRIHVAQMVNQDV